MPVPHSWCVSAATLKGAEGNRFQQSSLLLEQWRAWVTCGNILGVNNLAEIQHSLSKIRNTVCKVYVGEMEISRRFLWPLLSFCANDFKCTYDFILIGKSISRDYSILLFSKIISFWLCKYVDMCKIWYRKAQSTRNAPPPSWHEKLIFEWRRKLHEKMIMRFLSTM